MELDIFVVDAFTDKQFKGNSAAVVPLDDWISDHAMQQIAAENNLSETAFIKCISNVDVHNSMADDALDIDIYDVDVDDIVMDGLKTGLKANAELIDGKKVIDGTGKCHRYEIRWFSPLTEIDFCGHATLASSFVIFNCFGLAGDIEFVTLSVGHLTVKHLNDGRIEMSFPNQCPEPVSDIPSPILDGLSLKPVQVLMNRQAYVVVLATKQDVIDVEYDAEQLKLLAPYDVVVTASDECACEFSEQVNSPISHIDTTDYDFVSRYFWPANGGNEDPVTGSIHAGLAPFWSTILNKQTLVAYQASVRGGTLYCDIKGDRIFVSGFGVLYLQGKIHI